MATKTRNAKAKTLRGATYIRMSTGKQEDSPERQQADITAIPIFNECTIAPEREYSDHAMTGTKSANRSGFQRLLADTDAGLIDVVLLSETSRLTREGVLDQLMHYKRMIDAGVRVFSTRKGEIKFDDLGSLLSSIVDFHGNHDESVKIADRTTQGRYLCALRGEWTSKAPYAYKKKYKDVERHKRGYLVLGDKEEIRIVRWIFKQYTETDTSCRALAAELNRTGVKTRKGDRWSFSTVLKMLRRPAYKGEAVYNQTTRAQFRTILDGKVSQAPGKSQVKPSDDWIVVECPMKPSDSAGGCGNSIRTSETG